jgi:hypothetical protein
MGAVDTCEQRGSVWAERARYRRAGAHYRAVRSVGGHACAVAHLVAREVIEEVADGARRRDVGPCPSKSFITSRCPLHDALYKGVHPFSFTVVMSASWTSRSLATSA